MVFQLISGMANKHRDLIGINVGQTCSYGFGQKRGIQPTRAGYKEHQRNLRATSQQTRTIVMWNVDQKLGQNIRMHRRILGWYLTFEIII